LPALWGEHIFEKRTQYESPTIVFLNLVHQPMVVSVSIVIYSRLEFKGTFPCCAPAAVRPPPSPAVRQCSRRPAGGGGPIGPMGPMAPCPQWPMGPLGPIWPHGPMGPHGPHRRNGPYNIGVLDAHITQTIMKLRDASYGSNRWACKQFVLFVFDSFKGRSLHTPSGCP